MSDQKIPIAQIRACLKDWAAHNGSDEVKISPKAFDRLVDEVWQMVNDPTWDGGFDDSGEGES